jgi:hypothetical protein
VFSIAYKVSIYSNGFNFYLDKRRPLGMINPVLIEDDAGPFSSDDWTTMIMDLSIGENDYNLVRAMFREIRPEMLLFTRRLRKIDISLNSNVPKNPERRIYSVTIPNNQFSTVYAIQGAKSKETSQYLVHKVEVYDMPDHSSRPNVRSSTVILAFPFDDTVGPIIDKQHIFAFMPLREISLPVTLTAA